MADEWSHLATADVHWRTKPISSESPAYIFVFVGLKRVELRISHPARIRNGKWVDESSKNGYVRMTASRHDRRIGVD